MNQYSQAPLYFIGWDYSSPRMIPLKLALRERDFPWQLQGIVHDQVWVDSVDEVPLIETAHFLNMDLKGVAVVLHVSDPVARAGWMRIIKQRGLELIEPGDMLRAFASRLCILGRSSSLGVLDLPECFDDETLPLLRKFNGQWGDRRSNQIFRAYLGFLEFGQLQPLRDLMSAPVSHPFYLEEGERLLSTRDLKADLFWEVGPRRSSFLEQIVLSGANTRSQIAFSSMDATMLEQETARLDMLLAPLGLTLARSRVSVEHEMLVQHPSEGYDVPDLQCSHKVVSLSVDDPVPFVDAMVQAPGTFKVVINTIRKPAYMLSLLERFSLKDARLRCTRPGPLGLQLLVERRPNVPNV